jgi:protein-S-isoprenylcysteine O-methyltransferase Ste14
VNPDKGAPTTPAARAFFVLSAVVPALYYVFACAAFLHDFQVNHRPSTLLWVASEGLVAVLLMVRRPAKEVSRRPMDWVVGIVGSFVALLARPAPAASALEAVGTSLQLVGMAGQIGAKLALGRSFGIIAAHRGLVERGPYRVVRHPIYAAYLVCHVGFLLCNPTLQNVLVYVGVYAFQVARILAEERVLSGDPAYLAYKARVRWRLVPGVF